MLSISTITVIENRVPDHRQRSFILLTIFRLVLNIKERRNNGVNVLFAQSVAVVWSNDTRAGSVGLEYFISGIELEPNPLLISCGLLKRCYLNSDRASEYICEKSNDRDVLEDKNGNCYYCTRAGGYRKRIWKNFRWIGILYSHYYLSRARTILKTYSGGTKIPVRMSAFPLSY